MFFPFSRTPCKQPRRVHGAWVYFCIFFLFSPCFFNTLPTAKAGSRRLAASMASLLAIMSRCCWNVSRPIRASTTLRTLDFSPSSLRDCQCQKRPIKEQKRPIKEQKRRITRPMRASATLRTLFFSSSSLRDWKVSKETY